MEEDKGIHIKQFFLVSNFIQSCSDPNKLANSF